MIMADAAIEFKSELFYGDHVIASVAARELSKIGFDLFINWRRKPMAKRSSWRLQKRDDLL